MSKGKTPDGYIPASAIASSSVTTATPSAAAWQGRGRPTHAAPPQASMAQQQMQYQQYATTGYQGRTVERYTSYQGRAPESSSSGHHQGRPMDAAAAYQGRMMVPPGPASYAARAVDRAAGYQGRTMDSSTTYQRRTMDPPTAGYQGRTMGGAAGFQGRTMDGAAGNQQGRLIQGPAPYQGRAVERSTGNMYQGRKVEGSSGKMAEDYKRERKLPPRVEEMLREQVNLDESVLHDAFAVAMEDLILEQEANFVAKGLCHLCGVREKHFVPVVNFCPHADENHSLCREHLRSVYRVRMEALFVGRNGSAPNRRLLRCLICTNGCPCTTCTADKEREVQKYKRYLLDTLRRSGQGSVSTASAVRDDRATTAAVASPVPEGRLTFGTAQGMDSSDGRRYAQYPPTPPAEDHPSIQRDRFFARSADAETAYEGRRLMQTQQSEYEKYPMGERNSRDAYVSSMQASGVQASGVQASGVQASGVQASSVQASSVQASSVQASSVQASSVQASSLQASSMQAQQKPPSQYPPVPKRAAKDTPADLLSVMADSAQVADPRVAARVASPLVHQSSTESPSAATVLNCAESEKSLVQLLSSLNQSGVPASSIAAGVSSQSTKDSSYSQSESRYGMNGIAAKNGSSGNAQGSDDTEMEASPRVYSGRGIAGRRRQADSPYQDQSSTSLMDSGDSTPHDRSSVGARSVKESQALKRKASESDAEDSPAPRGSDDVPSRDGSRVAHRDESATKEHNNEDQRQHQSELKLKPNTKLDDPGNDIAPKADKNENHSAQTPPPPPHRGPGRPRKVHADAATIALTTSRAERKNPQERKTTPPPKGRGRGRPPKHAKRAKNDDEETEDEAYNEEDEEEEEEEEEEDEDGSDSELDANLDYCEVCQGAGDLVCCDKCPRSYHLKCLYMTENDLPEGDWQCKECKKPSRFDAYSVAVASEKSLLDKCLKIVQCLKSHPFSKQFLSPVENVPMYTRVVKQPMDLSKIENKLRKGAYIVDSNTVVAGVKELASTHFANDIRLMWSNCKLFNDDGSGITRAADILSAGFERLYKESIEPPLTS